MNEKVWYCTECDKVLSDDEIVTEKELVGEYWGSPAYEERTVSTCCGESIEESFLCERCGKHFATDIDVLCSHCRLEIASKLKELVEKHFTKLEISAISDMLTYGEIDFIRDEVQVEVEDDE